MLTIAYIGFGNSVIKYHLPYLTNRNQIRVKSVFRRPEDRSTQVEQDRENLYPGLHFTTSLQEILEDDEIECVVINTPDFTHATYAKQVLNANKHVLVEKPFALSSKEALEVFDLAKEKKLVCYVNQNRRYDGDFLTLKKVIESNKLGTIIDIESHYDYHTPNDYKIFERNLGWFLFSLGVHNVDQMVSLFGVPKKVTYDVRSIVTKDAEDVFSIDMFYDKLKVHVSSSLFVKRDYPRFCVHGTNGSFTKASQGHLSAVKKQEPIEVNIQPEPKINWGTLTYLNDNQELVDEVIPSEATDYGLLYEDLHDIIKNGAPKKVTDEQVVAIIAIIEDACKHLNQ